MNRTLLPNSLARKVANALCSIAQRKETFSRSELYREVEAELRKNGTVFNESTVSRYLACLNQPSAKASVVHVKLANLVELTGSNGQLRFNVDNLQSLAEDNGFTAAIARKVNRYVVPGSKEDHVLRLLYTELYGRMGVRTVPLDALSNILYVRCERDHRKISREEIRLLVECMTKIFNHPFAGLLRKTSAGFPPWRIDSDVMNELAQVNGIQRLR